MNKTDSKSLVSCCIFSIDEMAKTKGVSVVCVERERESDSKWEQSKVGYKQGCSVSSKFKC